MKKICFIGHRKIEVTQDLIGKLKRALEDYVVSKNTSTFLFGSRSEFDNLCLEVVTKLKEKYPHIQRIYHRAEYPYISQEYREYLLTFYDDTVFDNDLLNAGKRVYVKRNKRMIDLSEVVIVYCDLSAQYKSGTMIAYKYALSKKKELINLYESNT